MNCLLVNNDLSNCFLKIYLQAEFLSINANLFFIFSLQLINIEDTFSVEKRVSNIQLFNIVINSHVNSYFDVSILLFIVDNMSVLCENIIITCIISSIYISILT